MNIILLAYKAVRKLKGKFMSFIYTPLANLLFLVNGVKVGKELQVKGFLKVTVTRRGKLTIGKGCRINSGPQFNISGGNQRNTFWVEGILEIGNNVGISSSSILCVNHVVIGNNVIIGGNTLILDSDFHALDFRTRLNPSTDKLSAKWGKVIISENVFIGARTTILKGVTIGENAIIGACSVVSKNVPSNEIWAGNPARFIKKVVHTN